MRTLVRATVGLLLAGGTLVTAPTETRAQTEPGPFDARLRPTLLGYDPFEELLPGRFGFSVTAGSVAGNSGVTLSQVGALSLLAREDSLTAWDVLDVARSAADGQGWTVTSAANGEVRLTLGLGALTLGLAGGGRVYADGEVEAALLELLTRGNLARQAFDLEGSGALATATAEVGAHATWRTRPGRGRPTLVFGAGGRFIRPVGLVEAGVAEGARLVVSADSVVARGSVDVYSTEFDDGPALSDRASDGAVAGSGVALDLMVRAEWARGALEFAVQDIGSVTVGTVEHRSVSTDYAVTSVDSLVSLVEDRRANAVGDTLALLVQGVGDREVSLPRTVRVRGAYQAASWLYVDAAAALRSSPFGRRHRSELGATAALLRWLPIRAGLVVDDVGVGYSGTVGIDTGPFVLQVQGSTLAGLFEESRGLGASLRLVIRG